MKHLFVPSKLAVKLKDKGFDEPCFGYYLQGIFHLEKKGEFDLRANSYLNNSPMKDFFSAPLYQQVIDWFREKEYTHIWIKGVSFYDYTIVTPEQIIPEFGDFEDYYEALNAAIEQALELH